jgi:glycosyltransferase involved in cell wall biosynthesis
LLCETFASLPPGIGRLELAGSGPLEETLQRRFAQYPAIRFLGRLGAEDLAERMRRAWFTVAPSVWYENNPMAVLESMAQGTPVLGASIGGIPELISHGESGWLFTASSPQSLRSCLEEALSVDPQRRRAMGQAAWQHVKTQNAPDVHLSSLLGTYQLASAR